MTTRSKATGRAQRPKGTGSVLPTKTGGFSARVRTPRDASGKRESISKVFGTRKEAETWLRDELKRLESGETKGTARSSDTLASFLREFYATIRQRTVGEGRLSPQTCAADLELVELYALGRAPALAATPLHKLTAQPFRELFRSLSEGDATHKPLAKATVSRVHRILRARLNFAVGDGRMRANPLNVRMGITGTAKRTKRILTNEQAAALLAVCDESRIGPYIATLIWTGMRPSEAAGLLWDDVDLEARTIAVQRALVRTPPAEGKRGHGANWELGPTKTGKPRELPMPAALVTLFTELRRQRDERERAIAGLGGTLVFQNDAGKPLHLESLVTRYFRPLQRRAALHLAGVDPLPLPATSRAKGYTEARDARRQQEDDAIAATGFPMVSLYELRHLFGTRLSKSHVPTKDIQTLMGHASVKTTLDSYIHSDAESTRDAVGKLEEAFVPGLKLVKSA